MTCAAADIFEINPKVSSSQQNYRKVAMADVSTRASHVLPSQLTKRAAGSRFERGYVLLARITPCLENGKTALALFPKRDEIGVGSTEFIVLRGIDVGPSFVYCAARSSELRDHAIKSMTGASGRQRVAVDAFESLRMTKPPMDVAELFENEVMPLLESVFQYRIQNEQCAATRDLLVPRLVTGKLDISAFDLDVLTPAEIQ
jgi:type I restriction enzyme S subunit